MTRDRYTTQPPHIHPGRINLAPLWADITLHAVMREAKDRLRNNFYTWREGGNQMGHLPGVAGEVTAALFTGQEFNANFFLWKGDGGADLPDGSDVKATTYWKPILKHPVDTKIWPPFFHLVYVNIKDKYGIYIGKVHANTLRAGKIDNYGNKDNYTLTMDEILQKDIGNT